MRPLVSCFSLAPIVAANGANYGLEMIAAAHDDLDDTVDRQISTAARRLRILDLGGASGHRAAHFAGLGHAVTVVDICDQGGAIEMRNTFNSLSPPIVFHQMDVANLGQKSAIVSQQWDMVHARRLIHWMPLHDVATLLMQLPRMAGRRCHVALCFQTGNETSGSLRVMKTTQNFFYHHAPRDVLRLMRDNRYKIIQHGRGPEGNSRAYKIFARI